MGAEAIATTSTDNGLGGRRSENFTVWNLVSCYHGDDDVDGLYARAGSSSPTSRRAGGTGRFGGCRRRSAARHGHDLDPRQFAQGVALEVSFTITGRCLR